MLRRDAIRQWLEDDAPFTEFDQKHLNQGSPEQAYWHHGYQAALHDLIKSLTTSAQMSRNEGKSSESPASAQDGSDCSED